MDLLGPSNGIITMQTPYMKSVLNQGTSGLQSDTVEGVIHDFECCALLAQLTFTSHQHWILFNKDGCLPLSLLFLEGQHLFLFSLEFPLQQL